jgi:hypothetical protein
VSIAEPSQPTAPADPAPAATPASAAPAPAPQNVTSLPQPPADPDATLPEILAALDELSISASTLSLDAKKQVFAKLNECLGFIGEQITEADRDAA